MGTHTPPEDLQSIPSAQTVEERLRKWFIDVGPEPRGQLVALHGLLVKFNKAINLVSASTLRTAESVHIADSILASRLMFDRLLPAEPLFDLGSGNGFPGLVFAILNPLNQVVLVERDQRKAEYLKIASSDLKLSNVTVDRRSTEVFPEGAFGNVILRGFAPLSKALLTLRKQVKPGGRCFHMKGDGFANELANVPSQLFTFWNLSLLGIYRLPETSTDLALILTEKSAE